MNVGLEDRVYLVTGGSRGLGAAAARTLVAEGAKVVISGRDGAAAALVAGELGDADRAMGLAGDNADPETPARLVKAARETFGRLDGALISGGALAPGSVLATSDDEWRRSFEAVFLGTLRIARAVAAAVVAEGSIAFVLSSSVRSPIPGLAQSSALQPGLAMAAKLLADELGARGVRVNGLLAGRTTTPGLQELDARHDEEHAERRRRLIPLGRDGTPEEFGRVAAFVLSPAASYVNGAMIAVDGGAQRGL